MELTKAGPGETNEADSNVVGRVDTANRDLGRLRVAEVEELDLPLVAGGEHNNVGLQSPIASLFERLVGFVAEVHDAVVVDPLGPGRDINDAALGVLDGHIDEEGAKTVPERGRAVLGRHVRQGTGGLAEEDWDKSVCHRWVKEVLPHTRVNVPSLLWDEAGPLVGAVGGARDHGLSKLDPLVVVLPQESAVLQDLGNIGRIEETGDGGVGRLVAEIRVGLRKQAVQDDGSGDDLGQTLLAQCV